MTPSYAHDYLSLDTLICTTDVWHDPLICGNYVCVTWPSTHVWHGPLHMCDTTHAWPTLHLCGVTYSLGVTTCVWHAPLHMCVTWPTHDPLYICVMWHDPLIGGHYICVTWPSTYVSRDPLQMCNMTHHIYVTWPTTYVWHDPLMTHSTYVWHRPTTYVWYDLHIFDMTHIFVIWRTHMHYMAHSHAPHVIHMHHTSFACTTPLPAYMCDVTHWYMWHDSSLCATWLILMCDMTHSHMQCNTLCLCDRYCAGTWLIHMCDMTRAYVWHDSFWCVTRRIDICRNNALCLFSLLLTQPDTLCITGMVLRHDSFIRATWLIHMCDVTHFYVRQDLFAHAIRCSLSHAMRYSLSVWQVWCRDMTHSYLWCASLLCGTWLNHICKTKQYSLSAWQVRCRDMTHSYVQHGPSTCTCVTWLIHMCNGTRIRAVTHSHVWHIRHRCGVWQEIVYFVQHDSFTCASWHKDTCETWHRSFAGQEASVCIVLWHDSFISVAWLIHMCGMTHSYVWHDSFICVAWLIHMCGMTHSYVCHDSFIRVAWLIHMCAMADIRVRHNTFICVPWLIHMCAMTHSHVWDITQEWRWAKSSRRSRTIPNMSLCAR